MPEARQPFPQPNPIRRYAQAELIRRKINTDSEQLAIPTPTIMPFVRFTSTKVDPGPPKAYNFFHMGLHGFPTKRQSDDAQTDTSPTESDKPIDGFTDVFEMSYGAEDIVGYAFDPAGKQIPVASTDFVLTKDDFPAEGRHPIPGVTNISVKHMGSNEPIETTVNWTCYNTTQLEFLRQHFLMAGGYVVVEFGNYWSNRASPPVFDFSNHADALSKLTTFVVGGRAQMSDELFEPARGNYNMLIGRVVDSSMNFSSDGSINCSTKFYSTGEAVFGLQSHALLGRLTESEEQQTFHGTIADFFSDTGRFDQMLNDAPTVVQMKARTDTEVRTSAGADEATTEAILTKFRSKHSAIFIPWEWFIRDVMEELFAAVSRDDISADAALFTQINLQEPAVGNHHLLASTDPSTLVIVKSSMIEGNQQETVNRQIDAQASFGIRFQDNEIEFVSGSGEAKEEKGLLTNGVWINVEAIKESFTNTNSFYQGWNHLLMRMNNAVENYWDLDLAFDEETQQYKIYDKRCVFGEKSIPEPYVFNRANTGELLELSFDASFSKESRTALMVTSRIRTRQEMQAGETEQGAVNQPNVWSVILNVPDLKDELGDSVHESRTSTIPSTGQSREPTANPGANPSRAAVTEDTENTVTSTTNSAEFDRDRQQRLARFSDAMGAYIVSPTQLMSSVFEDGLDNENQINNFVAPVPTEINMSLKMVGITGLAFFDTFLVDKLPRIYRDHGVFLIDGIQHDVTPGEGWTTTVAGIYYFISQRGRGQVSDSPVGPTQRFTAQGEDDSEQSGITKREKRILLEDSQKGTLL